MGVGDFVVNVVELRRDALSNGGNLRAIDDVLAGTSDDQQNQKQVADIAGLELLYRRWGNGGRWGICAHQIDRWRKVLSGKRSDGISRIGEIFG